MRRTATTSGSRGGSPPTSSSSSASGWSCAKGRVYVFAQSVNEELLAQAGFELVRREDLTENMAAMAGRWHDARERFRDDLVAGEGAETFQDIQRCLSACHVLARERRLSRFAFVASR